MPKRKNEKDDAVQTDQSFRYVTSDTLTPPNIARRNLKFLWLEGTSNDPFLIFVGVFDISAQKIIKISAETVCCKTTQHLFIALRDRLNKRLELIGKGGKFFETDQASMKMKDRSNEIYIGKEVFKLPHYLAIENIFSGLNYHFIYANKNTFFGNNIELNLSELKITENMFEEGFLKTAQRMSINSTKDILNTLDQQPLVSQQSADGENKRQKTKESISIEITNTVSSPTATLEDLADLATIEFN